MARWAMMLDDGVAATVVVAEDLAEEAPDGGDGSEHSVSILDAMLIESVEDAQFAQGVGERQSLAAREASADLLQGGQEPRKNKLSKIALSIPAFCQIVSACWTRRRSNGFE